MKTKIDLPDEFIKIIENNLGEESKDFFLALDQDPVLSVRNNKTKHLNFFDDEEKVNWNNQGHYLKNRPSFTLDPAFHAGAYYVQEASSMFIGYVLDKLPLKKGGLRVLDLCAAPGGKSTIIADWLAEDDLLVSNEVIKSRVGVLKENLLKWGFENHVVSNHDPETFSDLDGFFDVVLVDAPCSGEGLFRKDPKAVNEWSTDAVKMCSLRQQRILSAAALLVRKGGYLIYSTCTYNTLENDENVNWLSRTLDLKPEKIDVPSEWNIKNTNHGYQFYPHKTRGEGFYISVLRQEANLNNKTRPRLGLNKLPWQQQNILNPWLSEKALEDFNFYVKPDGNIVALRKSLLEDYGVVFNALFKRSSGFEIGIVKGKDFIPSHGLALSNMLSKSVNKLPLNKQESLKFLKKEGFDAEPAIEGWSLVTYEGLGLGFIKKMTERVNNYLPSEWRIRMELDN